MKELKTQVLLNKKQSIESVVNKQQEKELKFIGSLVPMRGHKLWEINIDTLEVKEAEYKVEEVLGYHEAQDSSTKKVIVKKNCVYISALSPKTALNRYKKGKGSAEIKGKLDIKNLF